MLKCTSISGDGPSTAAARRLECVYRDWRGVRGPPTGKYGNAEILEVGSSEVKDYVRGEPMVVVERFIPVKYTHVTTL